MTGRVRKGRGVLIKVSLDELEEPTLEDKVKRHLMMHPREAYTKVGLIVEIFERRFKKEQFNGSYKSWPEGAASIYNKIGLILKRLVDEKCIASQKHGKANVYFWVGSSPPISN